jgi:tetratricopeptide (TPR) repeat protein
MKCWKFVPVRILAILIFGLALSGIAAAQSAALDQANEYYETQDWAKAAPAYEALVQANPSDAQSWYRWGVALAGIGQYQKAIECYTKAGDLKFHKFSVLFRTAKAYARLGEKEKAFQTLDKIIEIGYGPGSVLSSDADLATLSSDPRFAAVLDKADHNSYPCKFKQEYQQFDFWVGEWDVKQTGIDQQVGTSIIQKILDGCVLLENWTSGIGGTGKSFNIFDSNTNKWEQYWVDSNGGRIFFSGQLNGKVLDYYAETDESGKKATRHLQFFNQGPDQVRQFSQRSEDGGKTWSVEYDFTYFRKKSGN